MTIELVWTTELEGDLDIKQFADGLLERAKESLQKDGSLQSGIFIVSDAQVQCYSVSFSKYEEKEAAYGEAVQKARALGALAIVTLNDAYVGEKYDPNEEYEWGQIATNPKGECIFLTISGPGLKNCTKTIEYRRGPGRIEFSPTQEEENSFVGILGEWSENRERTN